MSSCDICCCDTNEIETMERTVTITPQKTVMVTTEASPAIEDAVEKDEKPP